jgi:hypothetical protein
MQLLANWICRAIIDNGFFPASWRDRRGFAVSCMKMQIFWQRRKVRRGHIWPPCQRSGFGRPTQSTSEPAHRHLRYGVRSTTYRQHSVAHMLVSDCTNLLCLSSLPPRKYRAHQVSSQRRFCAPFIPCPQIKLVPPSGLMAARFWLAVMSGRIRARLGWGRCWLAIQIHRGRRSGPWREECVLNGGRCPRENQGEHADGCCGR